MLDTKRLIRLSALTGLVGALILGSSFAINPGPPQGITTAQVMVWGQHNVTGILLGTWTQATGTLLIVLFFLGLVWLSQGLSRITGWLTLLASGCVLLISLVECSGYLAAVYSGQSHDLASLATSLIIIKADQHLYFLSLPVFLPLSLLLWNSSLLPRLFCYLALVLGVAFILWGFAGLFLDWLIMVAILPGLMAAWVVAATLTLLIRHRR